MSLKLSTQPIPDHKTYRRERFMAKMLFYLSDQTGISLLVRVYTTQMKSDDSETKIKGKYHRSRIL